MDEILYHLSRHLDTLQLQIDTGIQYCRHIRIAICDSVMGVAQGIFSLPGYNQLKSILERSISIIHSTVRTCSTVLAQPSDIYSHISDFGRIEMPIIYPGSVGFVAGAAVGVMVALAWRVSVISAKRMRAVVSLSYNGLDALACVDDAIMPSITRPQEILIQVKSASVDVVDIKISYGYGRALRRLLNSSAKDELPLILGRDCAGVVVEIGAKVTNFDIGDEVWLVSPFWCSGTLAEYVLTTEDMVAKKPSRLSFEAAASIPYAGCLAYDACKKAGIIDNSSRKRVLIHSGVSPVGCIACQLAKLNNCEVTVTCSASASSVARFLKADKVIIYGQIEMENNLSQDRFDVVLNTVGGVGHESCMKLCKPDGIVVSTVPEHILYDDYTFPLSVFHSLFLRIRYCYKKLSKSSNKWGDVDFSGEILDKLRILVDSRLLQPVVDKIFVPEDAMIALQHCDSVHAIGKTIVQIR
ncbi:UNVERIFIED_CONTAM: hypothetical protein PYX00_004947 [Menopon gallinae]|uniref:Enoyl reductase (ER) domain-containing protein n=1 Tax=Menopon gallinae TaxID=328185 RepID=A0AAW2I7E6_9NEOP